MVQQGARMDTGDIPEVTRFDTPEGNNHFPASFVAPLTDCGLIQVTGEEAAHFLHNQLTNDVEHLTETEARLAGYCSPKGRLLATFLMWKSADTIQLQLPYQMQAAIQKRLQMFVLRAKVKLTDVTPSSITLGLAGQSASAALVSWFPEIPAQPYAKITSEQGTLIRLADALDAPRYLWLTTADIAEKAWPQLTRTLSPAAPHVWRRTDILAGIPRITLSTQEQFVPQMVNFELIGGVNFKKGCYPGQEIVARSQYLGKLKRRMMLASIDSLQVKPGMEIFSSMDREQPCGMIVNAECNGESSMDCLVEIKSASINEGSVHLGSSEGPPLRFGILPYSVADKA